MLMQPVYASNRQRKGKYKSLEVGQRGKSMGKYFDIDKEVLIQSCGWEMVRVQKVAKKKIISERQFWRQGRRIIGDPDNR